MLPDKYYIKNLSSYFQKTNFLPKKSNICIIILNYNNKKCILQLAKYLDEVDCDVLIVDNNSNDNSYEELLNNYKDKFNLIQTNDNLGGAGGFGLGIQWVIERDYEYCFVSEEDALPLKGDEDIFQEMLKYRDKNKIIVAKFYDVGLNSFNLHYTIYPTYILKEAGTVNKDLFFRADDQEWGMRVRNVIKSKNLQIENYVVDRYYTHPLIKQGFGLFANYFSIRNVFIVYLKYPSKNFMFDYFINFTKYCSYSLFTKIFDNNNAPLKQFYYAFKDFLFNDLTKNKLRIEMFQKDKLEPKNYELETLSFDEFYDRFQKHKVITSSLKNKHFEKYNFSKKTYTGVISSKYNGVARIKSLWYKNIIFVEEVNFIDKKISFFKYKNKNIFKSRFSIIVSIAISVMIGLFFMPTIMFKKIKS